MEKISLETFAIAYFSFNFLSALWFVFKSVTEKKVKDYEMFEGNKKAIALLYVATFIFNILMALPFVLFVKPFMKKESV